MKTFWINKFRHSPQIGYSLGGYLLITCSGIFLGILIYNADLSYAQEWVQTASTGQILSVFCCWFIGAIFGGLCSGGLIDRTGRKLILFISAIPFILGGIVILIFPNVVAALACAYFMLGCGYGSINISLTAYIGEIATKTNRGTLIVTKQLFFFLGVLIYTAINRFHHHPSTNVGDVIDFNIIIGITVIALSVTSLMLTYWVTKESPVYLLKKCVHTESYVIFMRSQNAFVETAEVKMDFEQLKTMVQSDKTKTESILKDRVLLKGVLLRVLYVLAFNYPLNITTIVVSSSGLEGNYRLMPFILTILKVVASLIAALTLDAFGRRKHFVNSFIVVPFLLYVSGICILTNTTGQPTAIAAETAITLGLLTVADCFTTELFTTQNKALGLTLLNTLENLLQLILVLVTFASVNVLDADLTKTFACVVFFVVATLIAVYNAFQWPETKNLALPDASNRLASYVNFKF